MKTIGLYPGTFDPITNGHIDIASRAAILFDQLVIGIYDRPLKSLLFSTEERIAMANEALKDLPHVRVEGYSGLTVNFARQLGARFIVRGLRVISDFELEFQMAQINRKLAPEIDMICLMTDIRYAFLSSSIVKEVAMAGGCLEEMVPPHVAGALAKKFADAKARAEANVKLISLRD
ncbi:MAG: pantetheine-phosphate adenylyltransferase [Chloroflexi bacterium]|nr:pantetheine-phosphate adenylyltransferase [Chloroflexota bacterium]